MLRLQCDRSGVHILALITRQWRVGSVHRLRPRGLLNMIHSRPPATAPAAVRARVGRAARRVSIASNRRATSTLLRFARWDSRG
jgi:hypothetical protein